MKSSNFQTVIFAMIVAYIYIFLLKNLLNDVETNHKWEISMAKHKSSKIVFYKECYTCADPGIFVRGGGVQVSLSKICSYNFFF